MAAQAATPTNPPTLQEAKEDIEEMGQECLGFKLRDFQVETTYDLAYRRSNVLLVRGTGSGKSAIFHGASVMLEGITIIIEPLLAVQADQTLSTAIDGVVVCNLDLTKDLGAVAKLKEHLNQIRERRGHNTVIYTSPQALLRSGPWFDTIRDCFQHGVVSMLVNDEAHKTPMDGAHFRPEFAELKHIFDLARSSPCPVALLSATATFTKPLYNEYLKMLGMEEFDCIHWGPVSRREIDVRVNIASTPQTKINELSEATFRGSQNRKVLVYTNDKAAAKTTVLSGLEKSAAAAGVTCDIKSFTADDSPVTKLYLMACFTSTTPTTVMDLRGLSGTSAMELGLNCPVVGAAASYGPPASMPALSQILGRVARGLKEEDQEEDDPPFAFLVSVNVSSLSFLYARIERCEPEANRRRQLRDLLPVLRFLFLPRECYHVQLEGLFSSPFVDEAEETVPCGSKCPFCRHEFGLPVKRAEVVRVLDFCFRRGSEEAREVVRFLYDCRDGVWPKQKGQRSPQLKDAERLVLQLVAAEIVEVEMVEMKKSGERPDGSASYSMHLHWALAPLLTPVPTAGGRRSARKVRAKQHEADASWAGIEIETGGTGPAGEG